MKKYIVAGVLAMLICISATGVAGCAHTTPKEDINANVPAGAPSLMPQSHVGRFENLGSNGCYGCHGINEKGQAMLKDATAIPQDHFVDSTSESKQIDPVRDQCNTCHAQG